ncbi:hypothetical protein AB0L65_06350 [Nonomuraea sp. NPDC052116]|uniref:hypothetical protein n=1 Tax=Nonomuraea sp. NPDC052116 TaxID=3155665 RepID=UPI00344581A7
MLVPWEGLDRREIATMLGLSHNAVRIRPHRARRRLSRRSGHARRGALRAGQAGQAGRVLRERPAVGHPSRRAAGRLQGERPDRRRRAGRGRETLTERRSPAGLKEAHQTACSWAAGGGRAVVAGLAGLSHAAYSFVGGKLIARGHPSGAVAGGDVRCGGAPGPARAVGKRHAVAGRSPQRCRASRASGRRRCRASRANRRRRCWASWVSGCRCCAGAGWPYSPGVRHSSPSPPPHRVHGRGETAGHWGLSPTNQP